MNYLGDFAEDETVVIPFTTNDSNGGAVAPSSAFEAADVKIYKDGGATEKATTNGLTMTSPFDTITGLHQLSIDTSNDTGDSGFWAAGSDYAVVLSPDETVDSQTVVAVIATFSLENRTTKPKADYPSDFDKIPINSLTGHVETNVVEVFSDATAAENLGKQYNGIDGLSGASFPTQQGTWTGTRAGYLDNLSGHTAQTGDSYARLGAPAGSSVSNDIAAVKSDTASLLSRITASLFSGITSLANWLRAGLRSSTADATALGEINTGGGTYDEAADSQEALGASTAPTVAQIDAELTAQHGAGSWAVGGSGSGAYAITVSVTDGTNPLESATVRVTEGANTYTVTTDASGNGSFSLDAATYTVTVSKAGYSFTPTSRTVTGAQTGTLTDDLEMAQITLPAAPADPDLCNVYVDTENLTGTAQTGLTITVAPYSTPAESDEGRLVTSASVAMPHTADGRYLLAMERGIQYKATCADLWGSSGQVFTVPATGDNYDLADA